MKRTLEYSREIEALFGPLDENLRMLETSLGITVQLQAEAIELQGDPSGLDRMEAILGDYRQLRREGVQFENGDLHDLLRVVAADRNISLLSLARSGQQRNFGKKPVQPKSLNQRLYLEAISRHDMVFGVGPAGTGKTYLAVAMAVSALLKKEISRIILARPAVEAGERLGFLPGTIQEKVDPYLRPLYDALYDLLEAEKVDRLLERNTIEIAPIAFMRGRTLNDAFIILDEAQNTTQEQMKMFLTRMGFRSKTVITGDITQIDLPSGRASGLLQAVRILGNVPGIGIVYLNEQDVVRHSLVQQIIRAYEEEKNPELRGAQQLPLLPAADAEPSVPLAKENGGESRMPGLQN